MGTAVRTESHFPHDEKKVRRDARFMLAEIGGNAFGVGTDTSGKEEEGERHSRVVKPHYLTMPDSRPSVRPSETILATLNALMVECTESRGGLADRRGRGRQQ